MSDSMTAWECECGQVEHGSYPPEECNACWKSQSFSMRQEEDEYGDELI